MNYVLNVRDRHLPQIISEAEYSFLNDSIKSKYIVQTAHLQGSDIKKAYVSDEDIALQEKAIVDNYQNEYKAHENEL